MPFFKKLNYVSSELILETHISGIVASDLRADRAPKSNKTEADEYIAGFFFSFRDIC